MTTTISQVAPPPDVTGQVVTTPRHGFSFHDFLNIINPLQHIPVVSTIYREITGDTMNPISTILGGALFGGIVGLAGSAVDAIVQEATGDDIGAHIMATLGLHQSAQGKTATAVTSTLAKPIPAFLIAEAAADRTRPAKTAVTSAQSTDFWRSLQRGGPSVIRMPRPADTIGPPKFLRDGSNTPTGAPPASTSNATADAAAASSFDRPAATAGAIQAAPAQPPSGPTAPVQNGPDGVQPLPPQAIPRDDDAGAGQVRGHAQSAAGTIG